MEELNVLREQIKKINLDYVSREESLFAERRKIFEQIKVVNAGIAIMNKQIADMKRKARELANEANNLAHERKSATLPLRTMVWEKMELVRKSMMEEHEDNN